MRILLMGEYSSFHNYLKEGLQSLGHSVTLAAMGDGWKNIPGADICLWEGGNDNSFKSLNSRICTSFEFAKEFKDYDVVQLINTKIYHSVINAKVIKMIKMQNNKLLSLAAVGIDGALTNAVKEKKFEYYMDDFLKKESSWSKIPIISNIYRFNDRKIVSYSDIIIPGGYEYSIAYELNKKCYRVIPMPVNTDSIDYFENKVNNKVVFFHGLNRENAKGTKYIRQAFEIINRKYENEVEIIMDGHMPFDKYLEAINKTNVMVDQCSCYGYGINGLISMAKGKVLMSGAHDKTLEVFGIKREECPVFHITPNVNQLVEQMSYIVEHKDMIPEWGYKSRKYVEKLHDYRKVAQQYVNAWKGTGKI